MSETFALRIDSIAAGGDGVGRHNGMVVFVPRTAPGDVARVEATAHGRLMRGRLIELASPSAKRVVPDCEHYEADSCGGCQLQHLSYEEQLHAKSEIIRDSLTRIGKLKVDAPIVEPSDKPWRYRRKLTMKIRRRGGRDVVGMHRIDDPDAIFGVKDCRITDERVMRTWQLVSARTDLLPKADELRIAVRMMAEGFAVVVEGGQHWDHAPLLEAIPEIVELWWHPEGKARRLFTSNRSGAGASFTQVNAGVAAKLVEHVRSVAAKAPHATAIDAYAGTGDIAVALAQLGARVTAIEIDKEAAVVCQNRLPEGSSVEAASVEFALPKALPAELVVVNPPRAGLSPTIADLLQTSSTTIRALIYVSCDPGTLARDLRRMPGFRIASVRAFDMFPQTAHVETVVALEPAA